MLECYYTQYELKWLDDLLPGKHAENPDDKERIIGKVKTFMNLKSAQILTNQHDADYFTGESEQQ